MEKRQTDRQGGSRTEERQIGRQDDTMEDRQAVYEYKKHLVYEEGRKNSYEKDR